MIFDFDKSYKFKDAKISKTLLWEYDTSKFDWDAMRVLVVQRVIERGWPEDFYAAINMYGGLEKFKEIIREIPALSPKDICFVCTTFDIKKETLKCYIREQSRAQLLASWNN